MTVQVTYEQAAELLSENDEFLLITHLRPDGDTCGSAGALCAALRQLGKTAFVYHSPEFTPLFKPYLTEFFSPADFSPRFIIAVDASSADRLSKGCEPLADKIDLCIDHHISNNGYAKKTLLDGYAAAAGELVFELCKHLGVNIDSKIAEMIYISVATDTQCFKTSNTRAHTMLVASECYKHCDTIAELNKRLFDTKSLSRIKLEKYIYENVRIFDEKLAVVSVPLDIIRQSGANDDDLVGISSLARQIDGVLFAVTIIEYPNDFCRVSVRSCGELRANDFCAQFGGGGHVAASGFTLNDKLSYVTAETTKKAMEFVSNV